MRIDRLAPGLSMLAKKGTLIVPLELSWRRAERLRTLGFASLTLFHRRWQAIVRITDKGARGDHRERVVKDGRPRGVRITDKGRAAITDSALLKDSLPQTDEEFETAWEGMRMLQRIEREAWHCGWRYGLACGLAAALLACGLAVIL